MKVPDKRGANNKIVTGHGWTWLGGAGEECWEVLARGPVCSINKQQTNKWKAALQSFFIFRFSNLFSNKYFITEFQINPTFTFTFDKR